MVDGKLPASHHAHCRDDRHEEPLFSSDIRREIRPVPRTPLEDSKAPTLQGLWRCRRRDSNPRHADYDRSKHALIWLYRAKLRLGDQVRDQLPR
jgi:hypothetical protein